MTLTNMCARGIGLVVCVRNQELKRERKEIFLLKRTSRRALSSPRVSLHKAFFLSQRAEPSDLFTFNQDHNP